MPSAAPGSEAEPPLLLPLPVVLRAVREARGITRAGWAVRLGYSAKTVQRWERGEVAPDAVAETALVNVVRQEGLLRHYSSGHLRGHTLTEASLRQLLADARSGKHPPDQPPVLQTVATPVGVSPFNTLPTALTSFIGRAQELTDLAQLLAHDRLVTLTGPGGTGKTRLALSAAAAQTVAFPNGVFFVDLAPLQDPMLVPSAMALVLGVQERPDISMRESVLRFLRDKRLLLVLDNYEHLLAAAEFAGVTLQAGPGVTLLVTSRAPLRVNGEREYPVSPLLVPEAGSHSAAVLAQNPAVQLFVLRAQAVRPDFVLSEENAAAVATICIRLDGLPLAIELAAARVRALLPAALLARLEKRLPLLTGGRRDVPARQQTLRGAIAWSYALLEPAEQRLFCRLGVFAGGCALELAEAVCNTDGELGLDVLDGVSSLIEKSLLREGDGQAGEPRFWMLETIREFALGALEASGEAETLRRQLAVQLLQLAEQYAAANNWVRLDAELDNARAVLSWCVERAELAAGVRFFWTLRWYLYNRGFGKEQGGWRQRLLALPEAAQPSISRAQLLALPPYDLFSTTEQNRAAAELEEAIGLSRQLGDTHCLAEALHRLAQLRLTQGRYDAVVPPAEEALALWLQFGAVREALVARGFLVSGALARGDTASAERLVAANRALAGTTGMAAALLSEAELAEARGDDAQARLLFEETVRRADAQEGEKSVRRLVGLAYLARVMLRQGDTDAAVATCAASLTVQRSGAPLRFLAAVLNVLAQAAERYGLFAISARLLAAVEVQRRESAAELRGLRAAQQAAVERMRAVMDEATFAEAWAAGETLSADAAIELGLAAVAELQQLLATGTAAVDESR